MTNPQTQPPADAAQFIVDCATGKHDKPPADIGEMVERLRAKRTHVATRPTIAELEAILAEPRPSPIAIMPDGSIASSADNLVNPDGPEAADAITALLTNRDELVRKLGVATDALRDIAEYYGHSATDLGNRAEHAIAALKDMPVGGEG